VRYFEKLEFPETDPLGLNDFELIIADSVLVYDNLSHKTLCGLFPLFLMDGEDPERDKMPQ
jgi:hypothetical protein